MNRIVSLCSGFNALDHAVQEVAGGELVAVADTDRAASTLLAHHYPDVPNFGDITVADWSVLDGADWVTAGWPCQPWSVGGLMKGALDERAIWPAVARAVRDLRPRYVLLENVPAIAAAGELARALGELSALGFDAEWRCVSAADVGAAHLRERIFIVAAHPASLGHDRPGAARDGRTGPANRHRTVADAARFGSADEQGGGHSAGLDVGALVGSGARDRAGTAAAGAEELGRGSAELAWGPYAAGIHRWERALGRPAPAPTVLGPKGGPVVSPYFTEWLMGVPEGWITAVPGLSVAEMVRMAGNGVVRQAAVAALRMTLPLLTCEAVAA